MRNFLIDLIGLCGFGLLSVGVWRLAGDWVFIVDGVLLLLWAMTTPPTQKEGET